jgi:DNA-binding GntR family transcriptional regulator
MSLSPDRIVRIAAPLRQQVIDMLRGAIADGRYSPGERLIERELCEGLGISRPVLREALRHLEAEGLVRTEPQRGIQVVTLSAEDVRQIYQIRSALESLAAAEFITFANPQQWLDLDGAMEMFETAIREGIPSRVQAAKTRLFSILMSGCGNPTLAQILTALHNRILLLRGTSLFQPGRMPQTARELRAIYESLKARDSAKVREAYVEHIDNSGRATITALAAHQDRRRIQPSATANLGRRTKE